MSNKMTAGAVLAAVLATLLVLATGCEQRREVVDRPADRPPTVERGTQGTEVELHQEAARRGMDQAGHDLGQSAREAGQALAEGARGLAQQAGPAARQAGQQLQEAGHEVGQKLGPAARQAGQQLQEAGQEVGQKLGPVLSDAAITARIKAKLLADSAVNGVSVGVDTAQGVVTLSGKVDRPEQKSAAETIALRTAGVRRVVNQLVVGG
jgi:hyperosmotically inducible protein